jgi:very-short-patch-repair endonuclease
VKEIKKRFARQLRKDETKAEKLVWETIRNRKFRGFKFRRQHVVQGFVLDFYCQEVKLGIEIDGAVHYKRKDYDRLRQDIIESKGINVIRIKNRDILNDKSSILKKMRKSIANQLPPLPLGEGDKMRVIP